MRSAGSEIGLRASGRRKRIFGEDIFYAIGINPPFGDQAVGGQAGVQRAFGDSVAIRDEAAGDGAETHEIEVGVFQFERIEGPFDQANLAFQRVVALEKFQAASDALILVFGQHGGHVGMQKWFGCARADQGEREADHFIAVEGTEDLAAGVMRYDKDGRGDGDLFAPDMKLQADAGFVFRERIAVADFDFVLLGSRLVGI